MLYDCTMHDERERGINAAVESVRRGDLIVMPTDTLYGLGADAAKPWSVNSLLSAKGRGRQMPPPVLLGSRGALDALANNLPAAAHDLMDAFWPGALTIVVEHAPALDWDLGETGGTIAVRMPLHPVALEVLRGTGPMAVSSANKTGQPAAPTAAAARDQLGYLVSVYLEVGALADAIPSSIVDVTGDLPRLLRPGAISADDLRAVVGKLDVPGGM